MTGLVLQAQQSGTIVYEQTIKFDIQMEGDAAPFAGMMPKEQKINKELLFNETASIFRNQVDAGENDVMSDGGGRMVTVKMAGNNDIIYNDLENKTRTEQKEFFTRQFLIEQEVKDFKWKMTGNQKEIAGYTCMEAETTNDENKITAWFTPQILVSTGPGIYFGLPGLILAVEENDGQNVIKATSIDLKSIPEKEMKKPSKGKKVTPEEFKKIVEEKMEEMGGSSGGKPGTIIINTTIRQ